jgi:hypothetical protein
MRPSIKELYGVDAPTSPIFNNPAVKEFYEARIELLHKRMVNVAEAMGAEDDYEKLSALNATFKYLDKAMNANKADYEEIFR